MKFVKSDAAPAFEAVDAKGNIWKIPQALKGKRLVLVFLRHLGCPLCMRRIDQLKKDYGKFGKAGAELMVVVESTGPRVAKYSTKKSIPYPLVGNKDKSLYDLFGVARGGLMSFLAPKVLRESAKAALKGYFHGKFEGDELQKPAEFIISPDGVIEWTHYGKDISDASSNQTLLDELKALA